MKPVENEHFVVVPLGGALFALRRVDFEVVVPVKPEDELPTPEEGRYCGRMKYGDTQIPVVDFAWLTDIAAEETSEQQYHTAVVVRVKHRKGQRLVGLVSKVPEMHRRYKLEVTTMPHALTHQDEQMLASAAITVDRKEYYVLKVRDLLDGDRLKGIFEQFDNP